MPTYLELDQSAISRPTGLDVVYLQAIMLWPDDEQARIRWRNACVFEMNKHRFKSLSHEALLVYAEAATDGPRLRDLERETDPRRIHGSLAGRRLLEAVILHRPLYKIDAKLCEDMKPSEGPDGYQIVAKTINNKAGPIYKFRPVSHLWAAHMWHVQRGDSAWPCSVERLGQLLADSEELRRRAEAMKVPKAPVRLLRPDEAMRLRPRIELPPATLPDASHPGTGVAIRE